MKPHDESKTVWSPPDWAGPDAAFTEVELHGGRPQSAVIVLQYRQHVLTEDVESTMLELPGCSIELTAAKGDMRLGIGLSREGAERLRNLLTDELEAYDGLPEEDRQ